MVHCFIATRQSLLKEMLRYAMKQNKTKKDFPIGLPMDFALGLWDRAIVYNSQRVASQDAKLYSCA